MEHSFSSHFIFPSSVCHLMLLGNKLWRWSSMIQDIGNYNLESNFGIHRADASSNWIVFFGKCCVFEETFYLVCLFSLFFWSGLSLVFLVGSLKKKVSNLHIFCQHKWSVGFLLLLFCMFSNFYLPPTTKMCTNFCWTWPTCFFQPMNESRHWLFTISPSLCTAPFHHL